jgi:hypothetical protein
MTGWNLHGLALVGALAIATGAGCGSDSSKAPSKAEFVKSIQTRCAQYQKEREAASKPVDEKFGGKDPSKLSSADLKGVAPDLQKVADTTRSVVADIKALDKPEGVSNDELGISHAEAGVAAEDEAAKAAGKGDAKAMLASYQTVDREFSAANKTGKAYGLDKCG